MAYFPNVDNKIETILFYLIYIRYSNKRMSIYESSGESNDRNPYGDNLS